MAVLALPTTVMLDLAVPVRVFGYHGEGPGCGAKPLAENVRTFELAAEAEAAGFRCLRCRPYRVAGPVAADVPARPPSSRPGRPCHRRWC
jgi:hypothetical protein